MSIKQILTDTPNLVLDTSILLGYFMSKARDINSLLDYFFMKKLQEKKDDKNRLM